MKNIKNILIATLYSPSDTSNYLLRNFSDSWNETVGHAQKESKEIGLLGDVNVNYVKLNDNVKIKRALLINGFTQVVTKPARITIESSTLINIIAATKPEFCKTVEVTEHHWVIMIWSAVLYEKLTTKNIRQST